jgi:ribonuclease HII
MNNETLFIETQNLSQNNNDTDKPKKRTKIINNLNKFYNNNLIEVGVDEAGRGPLFGRVYSAACILPNDDTFNHSLMKDSKKFSSKRLILQAYEYIKNNCISYGVGFVEHDEIDIINIRQATFQAMHYAINNLNKIPQHILVDGNAFRQFTLFKDNKITIIPHTCIEDGDNKYTSIAAASIIAKVERDKYIEEMCETYPYLNEKWDILNCKGYGTKKHLSGIEQYGISPWHRRTFGICKKFSVN